MLHLLKVQVRGKESLLVHLHAQHSVTYKISNCNNHVTYSFERVYSICFTLSEHAVVSIG